MRIVKTGKQRDEEKYRIIISMRERGKSITEIGRVLNITRQGVSYYLVKYGDVR